MSSFQPTASRTNPFGIQQTPRQGLPQSTTIVTGNARPSIISVIALAVISNLLPTEPSWYNAATRLFLWFLLLYKGIGLSFMSKPGPAAWFMVNMAIAYGTWPFFYLTGTFFFGETRTYSSVIDVINPELGFVVDTGCLTAAAIAWVILRFFGPKRLFSTLQVQSFLVRNSRPLDLGSSSKLLAVGFIGAIAGALATASFMPASLVQPVRLLSFLFPASVALLVVFSPRDSNMLRRMWLPILLVVTDGFLGFLGSGSKQMIFFPVFFLVWLHGYVVAPTSFKTVLYGAVIFAIFTFTLPALQSAKNEYTATKSMSATFRALNDSLGRLGTNKRDTVHGSRGTFSEELWGYFGTRLCMSSTFRTYVRVYTDKPRGGESFYTAFKSALPRIIDQNKISTNEYYNEIARESGVGNRNDYTTSRKPNFIEECVIAFGRNGFFYGGVGLGIYLVLLEGALVYLSKKSNSTWVVLRFTFIILGQLPYFAVMIGANVYVLIFTAIVLAPFIRMIANQHTVENPHSSMSNVSLSASTADLRKAQLQETQARDH